MGSNLPKPSSEKKERKEWITQDRGQPTPLTGPDPPPPPLQDLILSGLTKERLDNEKKPFEI